MSSNYYTKTVMLLMFLYSVGLQSQTTRTVCLEGCDFTTIQAAINASDAGDIIQLSSQDYSESPITLNKSLTIEGANAGLVGNDDSRVAESRIVNTRITVTAAATLDGLEIFQTNNTSDAVLIQAAATFKNSIVRREGVTTGVVARGVVTAVGTSGYLIENNLINGDPSGGLFGSHLTWNSGIWINGGNGSVQGNTILNCRTALNIDDFNVNTDLVNNTFESCGTFIAIGGTVAPNGQFTLGANAFKNLVSTFINLSNVNPAFRLDITSSSYNGEIFEDMELGDLFIIEATMFHRGRSGRNGIVDYVLDKQFVVDLNPGIQAAVNASSNAGTICVAPGTYGTGNISINKALDIRGANYGINPNTESRGPESIINGTFLLQSNNISIDGFAITGNSFAIQAPGTGQSEISILNNHMYSNTGGRTIEYWGPRQAATQWTISNNLIEDILANDATAITLFNIEGLIVSDNVIVHNNDMFNGRRGLNLDGCREVNMSGNYINLGLESPLSDNSDGAFTKARYSLQLSASDRSVSDVTVTLNTFTGGYDGMITLGNGTYNGILISNNEMANNVLGIRFQAGTNVPVGAHENITIQGNNINSSNRCIYLQDGAGGGGTADPYENILIVNNSLIRSEAGIALEVQSTAVLNDSPISANCNWWGQDSGPLPEQISGDVSTDFWLLSDDLQEPFCIGPVYNEGKDTYYATIQSAIDDASHGDVIQISEGTFNETVTINKSITIEGAGCEKSIWRGSTLTSRTILISRNNSEPADVHVEISGFKFETENNQTIRGSWNVNHIERLTMDIHDNCFYHVNTRNLGVDFAAYISGANQVARSEEGGALKFYNNSLDVTGGFLFEYCRAVDVLDNEFNVSYEGVAFNNYTNSNQIGEQLIKGNTFNFEYEGFGLAINMWHGSGNYTVLPSMVQNNLITNSGFTYALLYGVEETQTNESSDYLTLTNNSILSGSITTWGNFVNQTQIQASCNWWGTVENPLIFQRLNPLFIDYLPYLIDGTDNEPDTPGFYPVEGSCGGPVSVYSDGEETSLVSVHNSIQGAINAPSTINNYVIRVEGGTFVENLIVHKGVQLRGVNYNIACGEDRDENESTIAPTNGLPVSITTSGATINGFEITAPSYQNAIVCGNTSNLSIVFNKIHHINSSEAPALTPTHAIQYTVANAPAETSNVDISDNCFSSIGSIHLTGASASAIGVLQSPSTGTLTDLTIQRNSIENVYVSDSPWPLGRIAYGILINVGGNSNYLTNGKVVNASIANNEISNLSGHIATGIGLEGNTENSSVNNNIISFLSGTKVAGRSGGGYDVSGLKFENNRYLGSVNVSSNAFNTDTYENNAQLGLGYAVSNYVPTSINGAAQVGCNWFGTNSASQIADNESLDGKILNKDNCATVFAPYLSSGVDTDLSALGFQPDLDNQPGTILSVSGNSQPINNGSVAFSATNLTLMGSVVANGSLIRNYQFTIGGACGGDADAEISAVTTSNEVNFEIVGINLGAYSSPSVVNFSIMYLADSEPAEHTTTITLTTTAGEYTFGLKGVTVAPEILPAIAEVRGNNIVITNGDFTPSSFDNTDFGSRATPGILTGVFTIANLGQQGSDDLIISDISFSGANASNFTLSSQPCGSISAGSSCQIEVTFDSGNTTGNYEATIVIANSDPGKNPYEFALKAVVLSPSMSVRGSNVNIENGSETPAANNNTFFGNASAGQMLNKTFSVKNLGLGLLTFPTDAVTLLAVSGGEENFEVITQPVGPLATNQETFFTIRFTSPGQGYFTAKVSIESSGGPFTFDIAATGPSPRMNVTGSNISIPSGSTTVATNNFTDFGTRNLNSRLDKTFYVRNPSNLGALAQLLLTGTIRAEVSGPGAAMFTVIAQPAAIIGINGSSLLRIRYRPTQVGCHWALITIANNDPARNPYTFVVRGNTPGQACSSEYEELGSPFSDPLYSNIELGENSELSVYPNPARTSLWIEAPLRSDAYDLDVINLEGKVIHTLKTIGGLQEINIHQWVPGMYVLRSRDMEFTPIRFVKIE